MNFVFNITNRCNLNCLTCLRGNKSIADMPIELLQCALPQLKALGYTKIAITGGEPFLHPNLDKLLELITSYDFKFNIVTNGTLCKNTITLMNKYRKFMAFISLSIDGATAKTHDQIRNKKGNFELVNRALDAFIEQKYLCCISICLNRLNIDELAQYCDQYQAKVAYINILNAIQTIENKHIVLDNAGREKAIRALNEICQKYKNIIIMSSLGYYNTPEFCSALGRIDSNTIVLNYDGNISFCCDTIYSGAIIGNIQEEKLYKILQRYYDLSAKLKKICIEKYALGEMPQKMLSCEFCNHFLKELLVKK